MLTLNFTRLPTFNPLDRNGNPSTNTGWRVYFDNAPIGIIPAGSTLPFEIGQIAENDYGDHTIHLAPVNTVGEGNQIGPKVVTNPRPAPALPGDATGDFDVRLSIAAGNNQPPPSGEYDPGSPIFFDDFDYTVTNDSGDSTANLAAFVAAGWSNASADNLGDNAGGDLYTAVPADIPGHSGTFPGSTQTALCINSNAGTQATQADFWLQYGVNLGDIPANVYFQFWVYVARSGAQMSAFHDREKFIYPTRNQYPAETVNDGAHWLFELSHSTYPPDGTLISAEGQAFGLLKDSTIASSTPFYDNEDADQNGITGSLGQNLSTSPLFAPNEWVEVRLHFDTSTATGIHEAWRRVVGEDWEKVTEWISGTPVAGDAFTWNIDAAFRDGHKLFKMPSTFPAPNATGTVNAWIYMQDFAMADDVADLPTYEGY